jgi:hypothetical protein
MKVEGLLESFHTRWRILLWRKCFSVTCQCFSFHIKILSQIFVIIPCVGVSASTKYVTILVCINNMGSTVILRRLEVITFAQISLAEHTELINMSPDAHPSTFCLFSFNSPWKPITPPFNLHPPWSVQWPLKVVC